MPQDRICHERGPLWVFVCVAHVFMWASSLLSFYRSFLFFLLSSPTLVSFSPFSSSSSLSHAIIAVDALLLRNAPNDPLQPINLSQIAVATSSPENLFRTVKANSNVHGVYFDSWEGGNSNELVFARIRWYFNLLRFNQFSQSVWRRRVREKIATLLEDNDNLSFTG